MATLVKRIPNSEPKKQIFTASGTFTTPLYTNERTVFKVTVVGGGRAGTAGGAGEAGGNYGGGGGGAPLGVTGAGADGMVIIEWTVN